MALAMTRSERKCRLTSKIGPRESRRAIASLLKRIAEHEQKLADFKRNPTVRPGMGGQSSEAIAQAQRRRIRHLETEIETFRKNVERLKGGK